MRNINNLQLKENFIGPKNIAYIIKIYSEGL